LEKTKGDNIMIVKMDKEMELLVDGKRIALAKGFEIKTVKAKKKKKTRKKITNKRLLKRALKLQKKIEGFVRAYEAIRQNEVMVTAVQYVTNRKRNQLNKQTGGLNDKI